MAGIKQRKTQNSDQGGGDIWCPSLMSYIVVNHLGCQSLPEITKMTTIALHQETHHILPPPLTHTHTHTHTFGSTGADPGFSVGGGADPPGGTNI